MNKTKIDWPGLTHTWNPVVGCKKGCKWCYAERMNRRFKWIPDWRDPQFFPERLSRPLKVKKPAKVFVGSMCELWGDWVPFEWIHKVLEVCRIVDHHEYMFLTKNPSVYEIVGEGDRHHWYGATVTSKFQKYKIEQLKALKLEYGIKTFISLEPIFSDFKNISFSGIDLVIVGAETGPGAKPHNPEWIKTIEHNNIHLKENVK